MKTNKFGQLIFSESDLCDLLMQGRDIMSLQPVCVDTSIDLSTLPDFIRNIPTFQIPSSENLTTTEFHSTQQKNWHMPEEYKNLDIAAHVLCLCQDQTELQRCGQELLLFQERDMFDLLRYLKYLVDVMTKNNIIWGVGRGSSVASYVLYKLGVHRIDSMYYNLDIHEFLR